MRFLVKDVVEEAMRTIGKMRQQQQQASGDKTAAGDGTSESSKGIRHNVCTLHSCFFNIKIKMQAT